MKYIELFDRKDRLGSNLSWYISTILLAVNNKYKIKLIKPKEQYRYFDSIFVKVLFIFIDDYNESLSEEVVIIENKSYFYKMINCLLDIKCDFVTAFHSIFTEKYKIKLLELASQLNYTPFYKKTIVVHLRLDDRKNKLTTYEERIKCCEIYKKKY